MLSSLVLPYPDSSSSRNSPIDPDYYSYRNYNGQQLANNDYYEYNSNIDVRSTTSTPVSDISWSSPNPNEDPSLFVGNNDGKIFKKFLLIDNC